MHSFTASTQNSRVYLLTFVSYLGAFIFGYDTGIAGGVLKMPGFQQDFGLDHMSEDQVTSITSHVVSVLQAGCFFGALFAAPLSERIGRRWALLIFCIVFLVGASVQVAGRDKLSFIYSGRTIAGVGVGAMSMLAPAYIAEVCPASVRGRITGLFQVFIVIGVAISYWIVFGVNRNIPVSSAQWRIPLAFQFFPVIVMLVLLCFCKESPRWLARRNREAEALSNLAWFRKVPIDHPDLAEEFIDILATVKEEREATGVIRQVFKKGNWIRFAIAFWIFTLQQFSGQNSVGYYAPEVFSSIGFATVDSSLLASGVYGIVKVVATSIFLVIGIEQFGRKKSLVIGGLLMAMFFYILGALYHVNSPDSAAINTTSNASIAMAVMIYLYVIPYCFSWGPCPWVYCSEIFSNSLRSYGMAFAAATQWLFNFVVSLITPTIVAHLKGGGVFFMFASINVIAAIFASFLPETRGVPLEQMDVLFGAVSPESRQNGKHRVAVDLCGTRALTPELSRMFMDSEGLHVQLEDQRLSDSQASTSCMDSK